MWYKDETIFNYYILIIKKNSYLEIKIKNN